VYDMYPWDSRADGSRSRVVAPGDGDNRDGDNGYAGNRPGGSSVENSSLDPATQAVQVALDRRDNGGDAASETSLTDQVELVAVGQPSW
jgi:hypothetical protein